MTVTIAQLLRRGIAGLHEAGIDDADISARSILRHILGMTAANLQLAANDIISENNLKQFQMLIDKRCAHVPLQYLIGEVEFYNVKLKVDSRVLIPRPETEVLVDHLIDLIRTREFSRVLDIGTGSGNIAIAIAANIENVSITAVDISSGALDLAKANAKLSNVTDKIEFVHGDCLSDSFWEKHGSFDVIVSNPPYVDDDDFENLQPEIKNHEPKTALITGGDPYRFFKSISNHAMTALNKGGIICFEVGAGQAEAVAEIIESNILNVMVRVTKDLSGVQRIVTGRLR